MEISIEEYLHLKEAELTLSLLERGGVDNWEWYGEALNPDGEKSYYDKIQALKSALKGAL